VRTDWIVSKLPPSGRVLDIGFVGARGGDVHRLLREALPGRTLVGVDLDLAGIKKLGFPATIAADAFRLPFADATFEAVVMAEVLEHIWHPTTLLPEISRVLAEGGRFIVTTPSPYSLSRWLRCWLFASGAFAPANVRRFLGHPDHKSLLEPLSFCYALDRSGLQPTDLTTQKFTLPFVGRLFRGRGTLDVAAYPFNRLGDYLCIMSVKGQPLGPS
jgi:SAM-dependent methyltransferase